MSRSNNKCKCFALRILLVKCKVAIFIHPYTGDFVISLGAAAAFSETGHSSERKQQNDRCGKIYLHDFFN